MSQEQLFPTEAFASTPAPVSMDLASLLNPSQHDAVAHCPGPQLILAGAGSGKTRVLTHKIAWLIREKGFRPHEILAVTFTNKAAREMRTRIEALLGQNVGLPWMGTFHSICGKILRFHGARLGYSSHFTIYDVDDQKRFVKRMLKEHNEGLEDKTPDSLRHYISRFKNRAMLPEAAMEEATGPIEKRWARLYGLYQARLKQNDAMDFDDLILQAIELLRHHEEVRARFQSSFRYILIDEYQDTNRAQYILVKLLLGGHHNLVVVGDDDQSIYGWRGADINNILSFQVDYPECHVAKLEQNYRSSQNILGVAASVIRNNGRRMDKTIWTENAEGEPVHLHAMADETAEAAFVVRSIKEKSRHGPGQTAVFYRTNSQSRVLEDELRRLNLPYVIVGGTRFYDRKEIKDLLAYLRVLSNPKDSVSLGRIVNVPRRKIGDKSLELCADFALRRGLTLYESLDHAEEAGVGKGARDALARFVSMMGTLRAKAAGKVDLAELIEEVIRESGYRASLEKEGSDEALDRLDNMEELVSAAQDFLERNSEGGLDEFLQEVSLVTDADSLAESGEAVTLMTVHSAKGLEFKRVFVTGLEDGLFPLLRWDDDGDVEEERRLFYVAVTRAEEELHLTYCRYRRRYGSEGPAGPSRFLDEVDPRYLKKASEGARAQERSVAWEEPAGSFPDYEDFSQEQDYYAGQQVTHSKFGLGVITKTMGFGESAKVEVLFQRAGKKTLLLKYAKLSTMD